MDQTPFKECCRYIPLGMYKEVKNHSKKVLDMSAIRPSNSPWVSTVVLVQERWQVEVLYRSEEIKCLDSTGHL